MLIIGLTGSLGTGKSTVATMFAHLGAKVLDADFITHQLLGRSGVCFAPVVKNFGKAILVNRQISRKKLAEIVFQDSAELKKLVNIIHPQVRKQIAEKIKFYQKRKRNSVVVICVPLLFESGYERLVDVCIVVKSNREKQIARATRQLKITKAQALRRIKAQMPLKEKILLADLIINNNGSFKKTQKQVDEIWQKLWQKTKK